MQISLLITCLLSPASLLNTREYFSQSTQNRVSKKATCFGYND